MKYIKPQIRYVLVNMLLRVYLIISADDLIVNFAFDKVRLILSVSLIWT